MVLGLFLITPSQADDIRDFQIEGMSVGDSLLDYFNEEKIRDNIFKTSYKSKKYTKIEFFDSTNTSKIYHGLQFFVKKNITAKKDVVGKEKDPPEEVDIQKLLLQMKKRQITHCVWL